MGAFLIGIGIGGAGSGSGASTGEASQPIPATTVTIDPNQDQVQALDQRQADLDAREQQLDQRQEELDQRATALDDQEAAVEAGTIPGSGVYLVGQDIQPGTYKTTTSTSCYWARLSGTSGEFGDIIANDNVTGQAVVTIQPSDVAFETNRCGEWRLQP